jgi:hypothetical protein
VEQVVGLKAKDARHGDDIAISGLSDRVTRAPMSYAVSASTPGATVPTPPPPRASRASSASSRPSTGVDVAVLNVVQ